MYIVESVTFLKNSVYLDNSATTKPSENAIKECLSALQSDWGNPSSLHIMGFDAEKRINAVRAKAAKILRAEEREIYFTSGGTEGNNIAVLGAAAARSKRGRRIVTTAVEHPSVLEPMKRLEEEGFEVVMLKPNDEGKITVGQLRESINKDTILVSIMLVNNETGAVMPVREAAEAIAEAGAPALLHCDAVQGFGKMPIDVKRLGVDMLTVSGHKIHAPKGVGFLYLKKGTTIKSGLLGGGQERGIRSGTEAVPAICGMGGALSDITDIKSALDKQKSLWLYAKEKLLQTGLVKLNSPEDCLPYILNISVEGYRSETMLHFLESEGVYVSSGSACAKGEGSYVLSLMGLSQKRVDSAVRISFSRYNEACDVDRLCEAIVAATQRLRRAN